MKTFMEEYGLIVVATIVIMIFVVVATPVGNSLKEGVENAIEGLTNHLDKSLSATVAETPAA